MLQQIDRQRETDRCVLYYIVRACIFITSTWSSHMVMTYETTRPRVSAECRRLSIKSQPKNGKTRFIFFFFQLFFFYSRKKKYLFSFNKELQYFTFFFLLVVAALLNFPFLCILTSLSWFHSIMRFHHIFNARMLIYQTDSLAKELCLYKRTIVFFPF